jgi:hypothetical protein
MQFGDGYCYSFMGVCHLTLCFLPELHLAPKTTTAPFPARHDNKPRKKPSPHSKDSKKKRKQRIKGDRRDDDNGSGEDDEDSEPVTTGSWLEPRTMQTIMPSASRSPDLTFHRNVADNSAAVSPSYFCRVCSIRLPLWATVVIAAMNHFLNIHLLIIF